MHFYGWSMLMNNHPEGNYNSIVIVYWTVIAGLFLSVGRWGGGTNWNTRFLRSTDNRSYIMGKVSE